jgi:predicted Fe-Mo cluster-binding NifX family protein
MKIAIASNGNNVKATISEKFARCPYFAIYDTQTFALSFVENTFRAIGENAGLEVVQYLHAQAVKRIISCEFGPKARRITDELKIQLVVFPNEKNTIAEITALLKSQA